jgi:DNA topoisomerase IA
VVAATIGSIRRTRFSAISEKELPDAFASLKKPDADLSRSVDTWQELDLRVGVAVEE